MNHAPEIRGLQTWPSLCF